VAASWDDSSIGWEGKANQNDKKKWRRDTEFYLPDSEEFDKEIIGKTGEKHLANDIYVWSERWLEHDWHVRSVEKLDWVRATLTTEAVALDRDFNPEALKVNDDGKHGKSGDKIHHVRKALTPEGLSKGTSLIIPGEKKVEKRNDGTLELGTTTGIDGSRWEGFPDNRLADVGGNEERDTRAKAVTFLKELIK
jgi:hypothetical protein